MAKRRRRRRRRSRVVPVLLIILAAVVVIVACVKIFGAKNYESQIKEIMSNNAVESECTVNRVSKIDVNVYSQGGIKYTNRHSDIQPVSFYSDEADMEKIVTARTMLNNIESLEKGQTLSVLPEIKDGYYWIRIKLKVEEKGIISKVQNQYNIDLYFDIQKSIMYIKDKYYDEFSKQNNKVKFIEYKVDDKYRKLIDELANVKEEIPDNEEEVQE